MDTVSGLFTEVTGICVNTDDNTTDIKAPLNMLSMLLDVLHSVLKYVSEVVRKALQVSGCPTWCPKIWLGYGAQGTAAEVTSYLVS